MSVIEDRLAVQDVMARYARHIDEREIDLFRSLFIEDVVVEGMRPEPMHGLDAWVEMVEDTLSNYGRTQHMLGPVLADIEGNEARARTDLQAIHVHLPPKTGVFTLWGTYETQMKRQPDGWRIVHHRLGVAWVDGM